MSAAGPEDSNVVLCRRALAELPPESQKRLVKESLVTICSGLGVVEDYFGLDAICRALENAFLRVQDSLRWCDVKEEALIRASQEKFAHLLSMAEGLRQCIGASRAYRRVK